MGIGWGWLAGGPTKKDPGLAGDPPSRHWQVGLRSGSDPLGEPPLSLRRFSGPPSAGGRRSLVPDVVIAPGGSAVWGRQRGVGRNFPGRGDEPRRVRGLGPTALDGAPVPLRGSGLQGSLPGEQVGAGDSRAGVGARHGHGHGGERARGLGSKRALHRSKELTQVPDVSDFVMGGGRRCVGVSVQGGVRCL